MSTLLTTPIVHTTEIHMQKIEAISVSLSHEELDIYINDYEHPDDDEPYDTHIITMPFKDIPEGPWKDNFRDLIKHTRFLARGMGVLKPGVDTDDFGLSVPAP